MCDTTQPHQYTSTEPRRRLIKDMPAADQPLARLKNVGPGALSDAELLAVIISTPDALDLASEILDSIGQIHRLLRLSRFKLQRFYGVGDSLAARIQASAELARRLTRPNDQDRPRIDSPASAASLMIPEIGHLAHEELWVLPIDTRNKVIDRIQVYKGSVNQTIFHFADIARPVIESGGISFLVFHNHPSGDPNPSPEDVHVTKLMKQGAELLDVSLLDHIIVARNGYCSLNEKGFLS